MTLFEPEVDYTAVQKVPNIDKKLLKDLQNCYQKEIAPEDILYYIYAILYCNAYRKKYAVFLNIDFPRIPFTSDFIIFNTISTLGKNLSDLHLLKSKLLDKPLIRFQGDGVNDMIEKPVYHEKECRFYINNDKYFEGVTAELSGYNIGGYKVLDKYLQSRKGRTLENPDIFCRIATSLYLTIQTQKEMDTVFEEVEKSSLQLTEL